MAAEKELSRQYAMVVKDTAALVENRNTNNTPYNK